MNADGAEPGSQKALERGAMALLCVEDFNPAPPPPPPPAHAPEPEPVALVEATYSASELEAAQRRAYQEGQAAAAAEARQEASASAHAALEAIAAAMAAANADAARFAETIAEQIAQLLMSAMAALLPALSERHGQAEVLRMVRLIVPTLTLEPAITATVQDSNCAAVRAAIAELEPSLAERVEIRASDRLGPGDVQITWRDGRAVRDTAELWRQIEAMLTAEELTPATRSGDDASKRETQDDERAGTQRPRRGRRSAAG